MEKLPLWALLATRVAKFDIRLHFAGASHGNAGPDERRQRCLNPSSSSQTASTIPTPDPRPLSRAHRWCNSPIHRTQQPPSSTSLNSRIHSPQGPTPKISVVASTVALPFLGTSCGTPSCTRSAHSLNESSMRMPPVLLSEKCVVMLTER